MRPLALVLLLLGGCATTDETAPAWYASEPIDLSEYRQGSAVDCAALNAAVHDLGEEIARKVELAMAQRGASAAGLALAIPTMGVSGLASGAVALADSDTTFEREQRAKSEAVLFVADLMGRCAR